jgi:hypothetical protein
MNTIYTYVRNMFEDFKHLNIDSVIYDRIIGDYIIHLTFTQDPTHNGMYICSIYIENLCIAELFFDNIDQLIMDIAEEIFEDEDFQVHQ